MFSHGFDKSVLRARQRQCADQEEDRRGASFGMRESVLASKSLSH